MATTKKKTVKASLTAYYVDWSSWFDTHPYNIEKIKAAVKAGGGVRPRSGYNYGWSNQPKVVIFNAKESHLPKIEKSVEKAVGTEWIIIREKDWK